MPGSFTQTLRSGPDVVLTAMHSEALSGLPIARTTSNTLQLSEDNEGLAFEADLDADDPDVQTLLPKVRRGDLSEMSFAFRVLNDAGQSWDESYTRRTLTALDLDGGDVSIVTRGANRTTSASIRSDEQGIEDRKRVALEIGFEVRGSASGLAVAEVKPAASKPARPKRPPRSAAEQRARALLAEAGEPRTERPSLQRADITVLKAKFALAKRARS